MNQNIFQIALIIDDYEKALSYYITKLNFNLIENTDLGNGKRWVRISPKGSFEFTLLLSKAKNKKQKKAIGNQIGGRIILFLHTDDAIRDYTDYLPKEITIIR